MTYVEIQEIPDPDALGLIPVFTPPAGEEHPDLRNEIEE